jgi:polyhydroxyalkanoate synthase
MESLPQLDLQELTTKMTKVSQKIIQNFMDNKSSLYYDTRDMSNSFLQFGSKLVASPGELEKVNESYQKFFKSQQELWKRICEKQMGITDKYVPVISPKDGDRRFSSKDWEEAPAYFDFVKQSYLLVSNLMEEIIDTSEIDARSKKKLNFYSQQFIDALSPSNFLATNPEALKLAKETKGQSIIDGLNNLSEDLENGKISQSDMSGFEVGKNLGITPGEVVFENELMQVIQYAPSTEKFFETPLVIIPPWINKFYIFDLRPENSFSKFIVDQGFNTFIVSWKNPTSKMRNISFDDYVQKGALKAIEVAQSISKSAKVNTLGYCLGGTLLATSLAVLAGKNSTEENPVNSATFIATMIDFSDAGPMGDVIDNALVHKLERGELLENGLMHGHDMERAFNLIRANDLIWKYVVNNYLKGKNPAPFDLLFWTNDNTNLPANMYLFYLRYMVLENKLSRKKALRICDTAIDVGKIDIPIIAVGFEDDHISPCHTTFTTTELVSGQVEFILGQSGHVMGVINPPSKEKYGHYTDGILDSGFDVWKKSAKFHKGSWWITWSQRLAERSGAEISAPKKLGNSKYKPIEPAPGRYVIEKCGNNISDC